MKRIFVLILSCCIAFSSTLASDYSVKVVGFEFGDIPILGDKDFRLFQYNKPGGKVVVLIHSKTKKIVRFNNKASKTSIKSWKINSLGNKQVFSQGDLKLDQPPKINRVANAALIDFTYNFYPSLKLKSLHTHGLMHVKVADSKKTTTINKFEFKKGNIIKIGSVKLKFSKSTWHKAVKGKKQFPGFSKRPFEVEFNVTGDLDVIAEIKFFHLNGKEIKSRQHNTAQVSIEKIKYASRNYLLAEKTAAVLVKAKYWHGLKEIKLKVAIDIHSAN